MRKIYPIVLAIGFILFFSACDQLLTFNKKNDKNSYLPKPVGPVIARVNDWVLTVNDLDKQIEEFIDFNKGDKEVPVEVFGILARTFISPNVKTIDLKDINGKKIYLDLLMNLELLAQEAEDQGLNKKPKIAKNIRKSKVEILSLALLNKILRGVKVTSLDIENFYNNEYKKTFESMEQRKVREIILSSEFKAKDVLVEVLRGANFSSLASSKSISDSAKKGGDLGYLAYRPDMKFIKFWEIVLTLDKGQVSSIFKDPNKREYYIVKIEDIKKGEAESLNKVYNQIEYMLTQRKSFEAIGELITSIKNKSDIVVNTRLIE